MTESSDSHPEIPIDPDAGPLDDGGRPVALHAQPLAVCLVAVGGALGTAARYGVSLALPTVTGRWPMGTFVVNMVGALLLGVVLEGLARRGPDIGRRQQTRLFVGVGFCGAADHLQHARRGGRPPGASPRRPGWPWAMRSGAGRGPVADGRWRGRRRRSPSPADRGGAAVIGLGVALAGMVGAVSRFALDGVIRTRIRSQFPWSTLAINVSGSLLLGLVTGLILFATIPPTSGS